VVSESYDLFMSIIRAMTMPHPGILLTCLAPTTTRLAFVVLLALATMPLSAQQAASRFTTESNASVDGYLTQAEQLYRTGEIDAALALVQIARPLVEVEENKTAVDGFSAELQELQKRQPELMRELPADIDRVADYIEKRYAEGETALANGDLPAAKQAFEFTWLVGQDFRESRARLDDIESQEAVSAPAPAVDEALETAAPEAPAAPKIERKPEGEELAELAAATRAEGRLRTALQLYLQARAIDPSLPGIDQTIAELEVATAPPAEPAEVAAEVAPAPADETLGEIVAEGSDAVVEVAETTEAEITLADPAVAEEPVAPADGETLVIDAVEETPAVSEVAPVAPVEVVDEAEVEAARRREAADAEAARRREAAEVEAAQRRELEARARREATERRQQVDTLLERAQGLLRSGDFDAAQASLLSARNLDPNDGRVSALAGEIADAKQQAEDDAAAQMRRQADAQEKFQQAEGARGAGKFAEAVSLYEEALALNPDLQAATLGLETASAARDEEQRLERELAERAGEMSAEARQSLESARASLGTGDYETARQQAETARDMDPALDADVEQFLAEIDSTRMARQAEADLQQAATLYEAGRQSERSGDLQSAVASYAQAAEADPSNTRYSNALASAQSSLESKMEADRSQVAKEQRKVAREKYSEGLEAYRAKDIETARARWQEAVDIAPDYTEPQVYLAETEKEFEEYSAARAREELSQQREREAVEKLDTRITLNTPRAIPLAKFLETLSLVSGINYTIQGGVDAEVDVNVRFEEQPLHEVLDNVLVPNGLRWERKGDFIVITADLTTEIFSLSGDQARKARVLIDSGELAKLLSPPGSTKVVGRELRLDDRRNLLIVSDSQRNIERMVKILDSLEKETPPEIIFRTFNIRERQGDELKSLLENVLKVGTDVPFNVDRRILLDGNTLIIQDTPENIARAEEILLDRQLLRNLDEDALGIGTFNLIPRQVFAENREQLQQFGEQVVEVIRTFLYAESGVENARRQGRRLWYDPALLQLTVVDTQSNLREVADFIASLPQLAQEERFEFILLRHAEAGAMASQVRQFLGIEQSSSSGGAGGTGAEERIVSLRREGVTTFRDIEVRNLRVNENDANDDLDDSVELVVRTPTENRDVTLEEFRSEFVGDYELTALDVRPSGTTGDGSVRLQMSYRPAAGTTGGSVDQLTGAPAAPTGITAPGQALSPTDQASLADAERAASITIESVDSLNALLIRFTDVALYNRTVDLIKRLDIPVPQVSIATNFVEVNETRAKEFGSEFAMQNILNDDFDFSDGDLNVGFGRDVSEFRSIFEVPFESPINAGLIKGTTDFSFNFGALSGRLRFLESEGVLNVVTGPQVTVQSGQSASFEITLYSRGLFVTSEDGASPEPLNVNAINQVQLEVSPTVTQLGSITLDLDVVLEELVNDVGLPTYIRPTTDDTTEEVDIQDIPVAGQVQAVANTFDYMIKEKQLQTRARVQDGGTIVLGGFMGERSRDLTSGVPVLRNLPYVGKVLFGRNLSTIEKTTMLIFLNANIVD